MLEKDIESLLKNENIFLCKKLALNDCIIRKKYLLDKAGICDGSVFIFAIPYLTEESIKSNISKYAVPRDYHLFVRELSGKIIPELEKKYPKYKFAIFSDHSPIDERHAASLSGLGILGDNQLIITEEYSSYIFLGEIITSAECKSDATEIRHCLHCMSCKTACPFGITNGCLSEITQKKGELSEDETAIMKKYGSAWGCDICSDVCPYSVKAIKNGTAFTPIRFFKESALPFLDTDTVNNMSDNEFASRAYSWRGKSTIMRNLLVLNCGNGRNNYD